MTADRVVPPPLISVPRITTLIASLFVALSSGTNYVYSAYSPQLGSRLGISHTQLNIVGLAGNVGVYASGPIWGRTVDRRGPRILLGCAFVFLLTGYMGMRWLYDAGLPEGVSQLSTPAFVLLAAFSLLTGTGGNGGLMSAVNATAKTFPDSARASTTGLVISGFGLSAFFFSTIAHVVFPGDTSSFFLVLALGTAIPMIMGFFLIRTIPLPAQENYDIVQPDGSPEDEAASASLLHGHNHAHAHRNGHLLDHDFVEPRHPHYEHHEEAALQDGDSYVPLRENILLNASQDVEDRTALRRARSPTFELDNEPNVFGKRLFKSGDFWLLFSILSTLSGTGLMYINNVGSMSQTLYAHNNPLYNDKEAAGWQAAQVSTISLTNFSGRIFIGLISDFTKNKYGMPRSYCLVLVSSMFFVSQVVSSRVDDISNLWFASSLLGLAYGSLFSLFPTVCLEWFGMAHFSENWGYMSMSPVIAGNLFSLIFGRNLDAHESVPKQHPSTPPTPLSLARSALSSTLSAPLCLEGRECYVDTLYLTVFATFLSILLSLWAGYRDRRKSLLSIRRKISSSRAASGDSEVIWEDSERR